MSDILPGPTAAQFRQQLGRHNNDSSSSRETSPQPGYKRSFTPNSDDGDLVVPPIEDQDTPPPQGPILRQGVAFSWSGPIETYEPSVPKKPAPGQYSLPGQEVIVPPPPPKKSRAKKQPAADQPQRTAYVRKKKGVRNTDEYADQTSSFRVKQYDSTASVDPPLHHGKGPYNSLFRVERSNEQQDVGSDPAAGLAAGSSVFRVEGAAKGNGKIRCKQAPHGSSKAAAVKAASNSKRQSRNTTPRSATISSTHTPSGSQPSAPWSPAAMSPSVNPGSREQSVVSETRSSYYRHDYNNANISQYTPPPPPARAIAPPPPPPFPATTTTATPAPPTPSDHPNTGTPHQNHLQSPQPDFTHNDPPDFASPTPSSATLIDPAPVNQKSTASSSSLPSSTATNTASNRDTQQTNHAADGNAPKRIIQQARRLITVLIKDIRSGEEDDQLAEVRVPLRTTEDVEDGFWTDAKDVCEQLQNGASRIDGPARVYTLRGKYRQFFLRVTEDNKDIYNTVNIIVAPDKTLEIFVEGIAPPGAPPLPRRDPRRSPTPESDQSEPSGMVYGYPQTMLTNPVNAQLGSLLAGPKRRRTSQDSFDEYDGIARNSGGGPVLTMGPNGITVADPKAVPTTVVKPPRKKRTYTKAADRERVPREVPAPRLPSPKPSTDLESRNEMIVAVLVQEITKHDDWKKFIELKARPATVAVMLDQYRYVQNTVNEWVGHRAPFQNANYQVEKAHVLKVLNLEDKWGNDCTETLELLALYGSHGSRTADPGVLEMIADNTPPPNSSVRPIKRLLRYMRQVDTNWNSNNTHPQFASGPMSGMMMGQQMPPQQQQQQQHYQNPSGSGIMPSQGNWAHR